MGAMKELVERFALYCTIEQYNALDEYPAEDFSGAQLLLKHSSYYSKHNHHIRLMTSWYQNFLPKQMCI